MKSSTNSSSIAKTLPRPAFTDAPLVFTLNGFSKMFALPGMKVGWIGVSGDEHLVERSLSALELISDTFLPVNETAQFAVPEIFGKGRQFLAGYKQTISNCRNVAMECLAGCEVVPPAGGFYVTLKLSSDEEQAALALLRDEHILVHPGYFYDIPPDHLVMTFIQDPVNLRRAFTAIATALPAMTTSTDIIYVVHGSNAHTWWRRLANRGYPWWRRWSLFCCAVRRGFAGDCEIREFRWSGNNTHQARLDAGAELARAIAKEDPERRIHIIGHSHGGNVALVAVNQLPDEEGRVSGCLGKSQHRLARQPRPASGLAVLGRGPATRGTTLESVLTRRFRSVQAGRVVPRGDRQRTKNCAHASTLPGDGTQSRSKRRDSLAAAIVGAPSMHSEMMGLLRRGPSERTDDSQRPWSSLVCPPRKE